MNEIQLNKNEAKVVEVELIKFETKVENIFQSPMFMNSTEVEMKEFILSQVSKAFLLRNFKTTEEDNALITIELIKEVNERFKGITFKEIEIAFKNGLRGEYGEYMGLSVITFSNWIKSFKISRNRIDMIKQYKENKEVVISEKKKKENFKLFLEECIFKPYESGKYNLYSWSYIYDFFRSIGYCRFDKKTEEEIIKKAKEKSFEIAKMNKVSNPKDLKIKMIVERFKNKEEKIEDWKIQARKISVIMQFNMFKEVGEDLRVLIKEILDERS